MTLLVCRVARLLETYQGCLALASTRVIGEAAASLPCPRPLKNVSAKSSMRLEPRRG